MCSWLGELSDFPDVLRFVAQHSDPEGLSGMALSIAAKLPRDEAFDILIRALRCADLGSASNTAQAIALTKHPEAEAALRQHLQVVWAHRALWEEDKFINWVAFDATTCIAHLIELGAAPVDFEENVRQLSRHVCSQNRDSCRNYLGPGEK